MWIALAPKGNLLEERHRASGPGTVGEEEVWHPGDLGELVREVYKVPNQRQLLLNCCLIEQLLSPRDSFSQKH